MSDFKEFAKQAQEDLKLLAKTEFKDFTKEAIKDGQAFLDKAKRDLERWLKLRAEGHLTDDDLAWLIKSKKDLARMQALKQAGVSLTRLEGFKQDLIALAISTATGAATQGLAQLSKAEAPKRLGGG